MRDADQITDEISRDLGKLQSRAAAAIHAHWKIFLIQGIVMMALGVLAVALPGISTLAIEILVGWLFFAGGLFRTLTILRSRTVPGFGWSLAAALLACVLGLVLVMHPLQGVIAFTVVLAVLFVVEGIAAILVALEYRRHLRNWGWTMLNGVVSLVLAYLIWRGWPGSAAWAIGLLVGINMAFLGLSLFMTALAAHLMAPP